MRYCVYVPTAVDDEILRDVKRRMANVCGGYTVYDAEGGWTDANGRMVEEDVHVVEAYGDGDIQTQKNVHRTASMVRLRSDEDAVAYTVGKHMHLVGEKMLS
jgi:hypothetical protein